MANAEPPNSAPPSPADRPHAASSYDAVPYSIGAFPQTRPDRLATIATLFGMTPAQPSRCCVLELGCAAGGNIIPMALSDRDSQFVGIDLSARQIDDAKRTARELELPNVDFRALSILDLPEDIGRFDYVLCHGVYSWVPPEVQDKMLRVCSEHLAPQGVAYVSYNCYPGWHTRGAIREMLWYHTERTADPAVRIRAARGLLAFLAKFAPASDGAYGSLIHQELAVLLATPDTYLLHEHLEEFNEPLYFHQFMSRAAEKGLQYLGEAAVSAMVAGRFGPEVEQILRQISPDLLHMEQYMDFLRNRMFRQTLLCHADVKLDYALRPDAVTRFWVTGGAKPVPPAESKATGDAEEFRGAGALTLTTSDALMKAAMHCLAEADPLPLRFDALLVAARGRAGSAGRAGTAVPADPGDEARLLATRLLNCYLSNLVEFSLSAPAFVAHVSDRPVASPYARLRARERGKVINLRLETVPLTEPSLLVLQHLDGRHDRADLVRIIADRIKAAATAGRDASPDTDSSPDRNASPERNASPDGGASPEADSPEEPPEARAAAFVDALLPALARAGLLVR